MEGEEKREKKPPHIEENTTHSAHTADLHDDDHQKVEIKREKSNKQGKKWVREEKGREWEVEEAGA